MEGIEARRFHYHGTGHALSGHIWRPFQRLIEVQAPSSLPTIGGVGASRVENFRLDDFVSFKTGYTHVMGSQKSVRRDDRTQEQSKGKGEYRIVHTTQATAVVEGLNILDVVTADRIVARLTSTHDPAEPEGRIVLVGSKFENLRIAGCEVNVRIHHQLCLKLETFEAVRNEVKKPGSELRKMADETWGTTHASDAKNPQTELESHGALLCSIVKEVEFKDPNFAKIGKTQANGSDQPCPGVERFGRHRFHVRDFANIYLAEVLFEYGRKTLTMLRLELGSPNGGAIVGAEVIVNGRPPHG